MRLNRFAAISATAILLAGCATVPPPEMASADTAVGTSMPARAPVPGGPLQPLPADVNTDLPRTAAPAHYRIHVVPDMANLTFTGSSSVEMQVFEETDTIVLHANQLMIDSAILVPLAGGEARMLETTLDADAQLASFTDGASILPGYYRLDTTYEGVINTQATGLFALDYPDKVTGEEKRGLFTQFEAPDARRFAPMFDEPSYKATFDLIADVPVGMMAVSNMPAASEEDLGNGLKRVTFPTGPKMSSYLLFFGLGDFERVSMMASDGTEVGIVAPTGSGEQTRYALESMAPLMGYFNDYFGVDYPLPKLDNVTGPGSSQFFGAMENWGAILTFERILLYDPAISSAGTKQAIYSVQAHEVAHQWFGNIVTMAWWDDLWLNEGFASWMETKATHHFNPDWYANLSRVGGRERAMGLDSYATTHPVIQPIETVAETAQAFDAIAYSKGEAVISMLEAYAGEDVWRGGIRRYMDRHQYDNTKSVDLWRAVEEEGAEGLTDIAVDFTTKPGVPLVLASHTCNGDTATLDVRQSEFSQDRREEAMANPLSWNVPLIVKAGDMQPMRHVLTGSASLTLPNCDAVVVNSGQLGYFRTLYTPDMVGPLAAAVPGLDPIDQLGLVADNLALAAAGYQDYAVGLDMLSAIPADANPVVADAAIGRWASFYGALDDEAQKAKLAGMVTDKWLPRLMQLGFEPRADESLSDANLRSELIGSLGAMGNAAVLAEASRRFALLADDPRAMDGPLKTRWLGIVAGKATPAQWERMLELARTTTSTVERQTYYGLLGATEDPALAQRALDLALTGEAGTASAGIVLGVAANHPEMGHDFAVANMDAITALVDASGLAGFLARLAYTADTPELAAKYEALADGMSADARRPIDRSLLALRIGFERQPVLRRQVGAWVDAQ
ncbi:M1 family metallopeptidase [Paraurantiacibacter namhicola]|uniref:Aminopeptidase n=1 Tax=Paraurantiacibacter namhicola TaxID=645517 RepID=A0A1C7D667_9SPHN|nr:M1 family metallopeptidase [Paraurantiacibacter namhicola]ANU06954.1 Aminopeptidase N [Paraurantiacibacter namhicola]